MIETMLIAKSVWGRSGGWDKEKVEECLERIGRVNSQEKEASTIFVKRVSFKSTESQ